MDFSLFDKYMLEKVNVSENGVELKLVRIPCTEYDDDCKHIIRIEAGRNNDREHIEIYDLHEVCDTFYDDEDEECDDGISYEGGSWDYSYPVENPEDLSGDRYYQFINVARLLLKGVFNDEGAGLTASEVEKYIEANAGNPAYSRRDSYVIFDPAYADAYGLVRKRLKIDNNRIADVAEWKAEPSFEVTGISNHVTFEMILYTSSVFCSEFGLRTGIIGDCEGVSIDGRTKFEGTRLDEYISRLITLINLCKVQGVSISDYSYVKGVTSSDCGDSEEKYAEIGFIIRDHKLIPVEKE